MGIGINYFEEQYEKVAEALKRYEACADLASREESKQKTRAADEFAEQLKNLRRAVWKVKDRLSEEAVAALGEFDEAVPGARAVGNAVSHRPDRLQQYNAKPEQLPDGFVIEGVANISITNCRSNDTKFEMDDKGNIKTLEVTQETLAATKRLVEALRATLESDSG